MQCEKCGKEFLPSQTFCPFCGSLNTHKNKDYFKKSADEYSAPTAVILAENTVFIDPNTAYSRRANEFYRPHSLPNTTRNSKRRRNRAKRKRRIIKWTAASVAILFIISVFCYAAYDHFIIKPRAYSVNIRGSWMVKNEDSAKYGYIYSFTNEGFVNVTHSTISDRFPYSINEEKTLIVSKVEYYWNTNLKDFSKDDKEYWCVLDNVLYISNTQDNSYLILQKIDKNQLQ